MDRIRPGIVCLSLAFRNLDESSLQALDSAKLPPHKTSIPLLRDTLANELRELAIIEKCNAVLLIAVHSQDVSSTHARQRLLTAWEHTSKGGISNQIDLIKFFKDEEAIKYLGETAAGIHSVVIGDSQVYSQVRDGLSESYRYQENAVVLPTLHSWLAKIVASVQEDTALNKGNTSIERLSAEMVKEYYRQNSYACVIGLGRSGELVAKILSKEYGLPIYISNRTDAVANEIAAKYCNCHAVQFGDFSLVQSSSVIVLALPPSPETKAFATKLLQAIPGKNSMPIMLIDLASPPLFKEEEYPFEKNLYITLAELSARANKVIDTRRKSINSARQIVSNAVKEAENAIEARVAKASYRMQKDNISLDDISKQTQLFAVRDIVLRAVRRHLERNGFIEITTPYIVGVSTDPPKVDSGNAFSISWPGGGAFLRQSNQLYKQMVVASGMLRVFEVGPFWRAEATPSHRHLDETIGLDVELAEPKDLRDIQSLVYAVVKEAYNALQDAFTEDLPRLSLPDFDDLPVLSYKHAIEWLRENNFPITFGDDLGVLGDARIGWLAKKRNGADAVIVEQYPDTIKKFYTRQCPGGTTETFDLILTGWELASGAIRETDREKIERSMRLSGVDPRCYEFYLSFVDNAPSHGGFGMGFDRLIARLIGTDDIRVAVPFPRTFETLIP